MDNTHCSTLLEYMEHVPDPRSRRGQRFPWRMLLALLTAGLASGQKTPRAVADWVKEHATELLAVLQPTKPRLPSATTLWRILKKVDELAVEEQIAQHNQALDAADAPANQVRAVNGTGLVGQAVDGKELRGTNAHGEPHCLVSVLGVAEPGATAVPTLWAKKMCLARVMRSKRSSVSWPTGT